jgi:hypothetical protein
MMYSYHQFADEAAWLNFADAAAGAAAVDVIGQIDGAEGWHVNLVWSSALPDALAPSRIYPSSPVRMFGGAPAPDAPAPDVPVPAEVTNAQFRAALYRMGEHDGVHAALEAAGGEAWLIWEYANVVHRGGVLVQAFTQQLGRTEEQVDAAFRLAATITG